MSTSVTKTMTPPRRRMLRTMIVGGSVSLLCIIFTVIYEQFSHGATSSHMRSMFLMPLIGCVLPAVIGFLTPLHRFVNRAAFNLWNSGSAVWAVGCLFRGIVNISGRYTSLDRIYWITGWVFFGLAVLVQGFHLILLVKSHEKEVSSLE